MKKAIIISIIFSFIFTGIALACEQPIEQTCEELQNCITPSPEVTLEASPSAMPEVTVAPPPGNIPENPSDGRSDGLSSCPSCTAAPVVPQGAPMTGRAEIE